MQEHQRYNLLSVLQKSLKVAQRKVYLHRIIYIASFVRENSNGVQDSRVFNILIDSNIKLINEEYNDDIITGFGLFYDGYFINIVEGPEDTLARHLKTLVETFDQDFEKNPAVDRMKVLLVSHHINKRYYNSWNGRQATPPLLLDKLETTNSTEINSRHIQNCIMKLYRVSEYLKNQAPNIVKVAMDNISDLCKAHLPEINLLDFLLDSPALVDLREYTEMYGTIPPYTIYHETIWPVPPDFVPHNILGSELSQRKLMSTEFNLRLKDLSKDFKELRELSKDFKELRELSKDFKELKELSKDEEEILSTPEV